MAYTDPPTFTGATELLAAELNVISDDIRALHSSSEGLTFMGVQLFKSGAQSIPNLTETLATWQGEAFDYGGWWSTGSNIVVPAGAIPAGFTTIALLVFGRLRYASDSVGSRRIRGLLNGTPFGSRTVSGLDGGDSTDVQMSEVVVVTAGDIVTVEAYHGAGHSLDVEVGDVSVLRYAPVA